MPPPTPNSEEPLNAPFGARCFLTGDLGYDQSNRWDLS